MPLPNALHAHWSIRALEAGKHVLCEKPFASNAEQAASVALVAERTGLEAVEAFHWRYHALASRMREIVASGELGEIRSVEAHVCFPLLSRGDIRYRLDLAGGALMDAGCYAVSVVRHLAGAEPEVTSARVRLASPQVDRCASAELRFADGREGRISCSLLSARLLRVSARVRGSRGQMAVINPIAPHVWHRLRVRTRDGRRTERVHGESTYTAQLRAFVGRLRGGPALPTDAEDAVANQRVIDAVYVAAGLVRRGYTR